MSLVGSRVNDLLRNAKDHIDYDHAREVAKALQATGHPDYRYENEAQRIAVDVLALSRVLSGPDGDNVRTLLGLNRTVA